MDHHSIVRQTANFIPSVWDDYFIGFSPSPTKFEPNMGRIEELKKDVSAILKNDNFADLGKTLSLIDDLQRLGLSYHFEEEIDVSLRRIQNNVVKESDDHDISIVALRFCLLRQQGYDVSSDVFAKFKDEEGKFKLELSKDAKGLLYLYEASWLGTREEVILDEALNFSKGHMERLLVEQSQYNGVILAQIERALKMPFYRGMRRLEAKHHIINYDHENKASGRVLIELAKMDYNLLQSLHQAEIKDVSIWDLHNANHLPEYMREYIDSLISLLKEIEEYLTINGRLHGMHYLIEGYKKQVKAYFEEAKWASKGHMPTLEEYLHISVMSSAYPFLTSSAFILMGGEDMTKDVLDWVSSVPKILKYSAQLARIMNDIVSTEFEQQRIHVATSLQCYMNDHGVKEDVACEKLKKMNFDTWKDINKEWLLKSDPSQWHLKMLALDFNRMGAVIYKHEDAYTDPSGEMKENIAALLVHPIY